jgi:hypothetical protein
MSYVVKTTFHRGLRTTPDTVEIGWLPAPQVKRQHETAIAGEHEHGRDAKRADIVSYLAPDDESHLA